MMEYQARQAHDAGINHVIMLVDAVTPTLSRLVDRLGTDGIKVQLIRDMATLVRDVPRETDVLLFTDGALVDQQYVAALAEAGGSNLLVSEEVPTTSHLERIDGVHRWCGLARITPAILFGTLDLIGDWDFALTLLRAAVQGNARRIIVPANDYMEGKAALVDAQATADLVARTLLTPHSQKYSMDAGAEHYVLAPLVNVLATRVVRMQLPSLQIRIGALALALVGLLALYPEWTLLAHLLFIAALGTNLVADRLSAMARRSDGETWVGLAPVALVLLGIALLGWHAGAADSGVYLAILSGVIHLTARRKPGFSIEKWASLTPASALVVLFLGTIIGHLSGAVVVATLLAIGSVAMLVLSDRREAR
ncbi:MAG: hypothetical protein ABI395_10430 [Sphingobium sp.]